MPEREAVDALIGVEFGVLNALWAIRLVSAFDFATAIPTSICAARAGRSILTCWPRALFLAVRWPDRLGSLGGPQSTP